MRLVSWNVNGLRSVHEKGLTGILTQLAPDVACLQETKAQREQLVKEIYEEGDWYFSSAEKKGYSGVATIVRTPKYLPQAVHYGIGTPEFDREGRFTITEHGDLTLYNIYFPSGTSGEERQGFKYEFLDGVFDHLQSLPQSRRDRLIITGDFNICHKEVDIHHPAEATKRQLTGFLPEERAWMDKFVELGFTDTFRLKNGEVSGRYSWWSFRANSRAKNLGWRIDYFFVSNALAKRVKKADIFEDIRGSDHCPLLLELED